MRIALLDASTGPGGGNKDLAGGFGTSGRYGDTVMLKLLSFLKRASIRLPVVSLGYLASTLKKAGHEVCLSVSLDENALESDCCIVYTSLIGFGRERELASAIRERGIRTGLCGPMASVSPESYAGIADFIIRGEPEAASPEDFLNAEGGKIIEAGVAEDLDSMPFPDWSIFPYKKFSYSIYLPRKPLFPMLSSRGCPRGCAYYCPYPAVQGRRYRKRNPESVIEEIEFLQAKYSARSVVFRDPFFTFDANRTAVIAERILKQGIALEWACETGLDSLDKPLLKLMGRAGLRGVNFGIESSSARTLEGSFRKLPDIKHAQDIILFCRRNRIKTGAFYIIGLKDDTREDISETIRLSRRLNTDYAQFTIATPYPGTGFFKDSGAVGKFGEKDKFDSYTPTTEHPVLPREEMIRLKEKAMLSYYLRPSRLLRRLFGR